MFPVENKLISLFFFNLLVAWSDFPLVAAGYAVTEIYG